ncbi:NlpC/P60 family protein [Natronorarus salvus]|uniref:NlpC/P60 family protein n=1 Tax=Natronorarus salvus TaxID=3117733 RepID=UPI002F267FE7
MTDDLSLALSYCETISAPDDRISCFDVEADRRDGDVRLSGTVSSHALRRRAVEVLGQVSAEPIDASEVSVLSRGEERTLAVPCAPVRAEPDAERVTTALYGATLGAYDHEGGWRRVRTPCGYLGWIGREALSVSAPVDPDATLSTPVTVEPSTTLPAGADCAVLDREDEEATVAFRTGLEVAVPTDSVTVPRSDATGADALAAAESFLGTEYRWGGMSHDGIDCSGLVWIAYRRIGITMPRDADQQRAMGRAVGREALRPCDLLFFPGHVAISRGGSSFVHAYGAADAVVVNDLDPDEEGYVADLDDRLELTTRLL